MDRTRKNEIIAVGLFAASLFLFLSIFTFSGQDLSFYTSNPNVVPQNLTGVVGSCTGGILLFLVGKAAYVIPLLTLVWGISRLLQVEARKILFKLFGAVVLVMAVSAGLSMLFDLSRTAAFARSGVIGILVSDFLLEYLGRAGATVFIIAMIILSVLIATEFLILPVLAALFNFTGRVLLRVKLRLFGGQSVPGGGTAAARNRLKSARAEVSRKLEIIREQVEKVRSRPEPAAAAGRKTLITDKPREVSAGTARITAVSEGPAGRKTEYRLPALELLKMSSRGNVREREEDLKRKAAILEKTLLEFGVGAKVVKINRGPVITMYELEPAMGTKVNKITSLGDNISLAMKSANIRIVAPLPGKGTVGIEVPNKKSEHVLLRDILETEEYRGEDSPLKLALGKDISGTSIVTDLARMPHLLVAGATGSGKTVCLNGIISSLLFNSSPEELKFLMIDPKRVELMMFERIPHLVSPIVTDPKKAAAALNWVVNEMERRYEIFAGKGVRNIVAYKERAAEEKGAEGLPYIIVIVDELADLMMVSQQDVEDAITRIAQLSRAAGIHMILATQRPSVNVITGVVKANFPARISFKVASKVDSRTVLDANGAEKLLGRGDMLLMEPGEPSVIRGQCSLVEDSEIRRIVKFIRSQAEPQYVAEAVAKQERKTGGVKQEKDELYREAVRVVVGTRQASVSMIQRKLRVGYTRAARMIDMMEEEGIVGSYNGSKPREVLIDDLRKIDARNDDNA